MDATKINDSLGSPYSSDLLLFNGRDQVSGFNCNVDFICVHTLSQAAFTNFGKLLEALLSRCVGTTSDRMLWQCLCPQDTTTHPSFIPEFPRSCV